MLCRITPLFLVALFCIPSSSSGQSFGHYFKRIYLSAGYSEMTFSDNINTDVKPESTGFVGLGLHFNLVVLQPNRDESFGISPGFFIWHSLEYGTGNSSRPSIQNGFQDSPGGFSLDALTFPLFATYNYGADATLLYTDDVGFTVGLGYQYSILPMTYDNDSYGAFAALAEVTVTPFDKIFKLRFITDLTSQELVSGIDIQQWQLMLVYGGSP